MKIIELLNKIANGEEVPERIKYDTKEMKYDHNKQDYLGYYSNGNGEWLFQYLFDRCRNTEHFINDEVEIIEDKKIKRIQSCGDNLYSEYIGQWLVNKENYTEYDELLMNKINEIIDKLNEEQE